MITNHSKATKSEKTTSGQSTKCHKNRKQGKTPEQQKGIQVRTNEVKKILQFSF